MAGASTDCRGKAAPVGNADPKARCEFPAGGLHADGNIAVRTYVGWTTDEYSDWADSGFGPRAESRRPRPSIQDGRNATSTPLRCDSQVITSACRSRNRWMSFDGHRRRAPSEADSPGSRRLRTGQHLRSQTLRPNTVALSPKVRFVVISTLVCS